VLWSIGLGLDPATGLIDGTPAISQYAHAFVPVINRDASGAWTSMNLYGIYLGDSIIQWNASYSPSGSSPAYPEDGLFLGTGNELVGHHPTRGTRFWGIPMAPVDSSPAASRGYVFFALNATNGTVGCARVGDTMVCVAGASTSTPGGTDMLKIHYFDGKNPHLDSGQIE
jgi:hypothetical protein